ncbi:hypothetical protein [Pseudogemmobacter bohemicus]|uniref:hypothetical protein n=1 Tax=Pseudogemmobacter bohemicus TaxID=2250708 RepID=UPI00130074BE|nr:hypothetical protein [Pseudogemmobacter bohemicus]
MSYGFQIFNSDGVIAASSEDRVLAITNIFSVSWYDRVTAWRAFDFWDMTQTGQAYGEPNVEIWRADGTFHYLYSVGYPPGFVLEPDMFIGVTCAYGGSIFARDVHYQHAAQFRSDQPTITMAVARPIKPNDNAESGHGLVAYDAAGNIAFHSDSKVLRVTGNINGTNVINNPSGYTPFFFFDGSAALRQVPDASTKLLHPTGVRINSAQSYTRRLLWSAATTDVLPVHLRNPYARGFIGLVDQTLFP